MAAASHSAGVESEELIGSLSLARFLLFLLLLMLGCLTACECKRTQEELQGVC